MTKEVVIVDAVRTVNGKFFGGLSNLKAPHLASVLIKELLQRNNLSSEIVDEVIMGNVISAGLGQNPARQASIFAGLPEKIPCFTVNKVCGSGMKAVTLAAQTIKAGDADVVIAGGMESMSNAPYLIQDARRGTRLGHSKLIDSMIHDGLWDVYNDVHMGQTAELVVEKYKISRTQQDEYAYESQQKAVTAIREGFFKKEIVPVKTKDEKGKEVIIDTDEGPRADTTLEKLSKLQPVFKKDGTVTAGNSSTINDGASVLLVMSSEKAKALKLNPLCKITGYATGGLKPEWVLMTPTVAVKNLESKYGLKLNDFDLIELNETFAVAAVALIQEMNIDKKKLNVRGGAIALGHPIGASGARILTTLIYALKDSGKKHGLATLCLGGGNAIATSIEIL